MIYRTAPFSMTLNDPYRQLVVLHTPYNDMKRRAVSLRQLSFLLDLLCWSLCFIFIIISFSVWSRVVD